MINPRGTRSERSSIDYNAAASPIDHPTDASVPSINPATPHEATGHGSMEQEAPRVRQWLNLRNPLGRCDGGFLSLSLHVKFWVPVHLILQESTRNLFYMEARQELLENRIFANDWTNAIKLAALLAHADGVRFNAECLEESSRSKIANTLTNKSEQQQQQLGLQRRRGSKRKSSEPSVVDTSKQSSSPLSVYEPYMLVRPRSPSVSMSKEKLLYAIAEEHKQHADQLPKTAKYWLLAEFSSLKGFGEEKFFVPGTVDGVTSQVEITVGPEGVGVLHAKGEDRIE